MRPEFDGFAFSTSWNWRGSDSGRRLIDEILALGFGAVELNYRVTRRMLDEIVPRVRRGEVAVESVHNIFPFVADARFDTDSRLLGYRDDELRSRAVALTKASVEMGASLGAKALVVHPGVQPWDEAPPGPAGLSGIALDEEMKRRWTADGPDSASYRSIYEEFVAYRRKGIREELERILASLEDIAGHIVRNRIPMVIGLENRPMCFQIPDFAEMDYLLDSLSGAPVGMWFDTGHGAIQRHMGFFDDVAEATRLSPRLAGTHIHDVQGVSDHFAPYAKEGLDAYLGLIAMSPIRVIEVGVKNSAADIAAGMRRLQAALAGRKSVGPVDGAYASPRAPAAEGRGS